jgi:hypothetical protein
MLDGDDCLDVYGMAFAVEEDSRALFMSSRLERIEQLSCKIDYLDKNDILSPYKNRGLNWASMENIEIDEALFDSEDWDISNVLTKRMDYWHTMREQNHKRVA